MKHNLLYVITLACSFSQTIFSMNDSETHYTVVNPKASYTPYYNLQTKEWNIQLGFKDIAFQFSGAINRKQLQNLCATGQGIVTVQYANQTSNILVNLPKNQEGILIKKFYLKALNQTT